MGEKDKKQKDVASRFHEVEIATHSYQFDRQEKELEMLETVTLEDFKNYFEEIFFSDKTARLDLQLTSKIHKD